jgi:hypothetical protein
MEETGRDSLHLVDRDDAPLAELRPVRNQLLQALGLPLPKLKSRGKTATKAGPQTTELSSYRGKQLL